VQESFSKAFFAINSFSGKGEMSFAAWLARISFNACYDELRRSQRRPEDASDFSTEEIEQIERNLTADVSQHNVESAAISRDLAVKLLARLLPEDRLVLVLLDVEELSVSEIAEITRWSVSKVKVRAHRARERLRRVLSKFL